MPPKRRPVAQDTRRERVGLPISGVPTSSGRERFQPGPSDYYPEAYPYSVGVYKASEQYPVSTVVAGPADEKPKALAGSQQKAKIGAFDMKEMLKQEMFQSRSRGCDDHLDKSRPCPHEVYGVADQYMVFDSAEKVETSNIDNGEYQFNFSINGITGDQQIGIIDTVDTVIEAEVMPFYIPLINDVAYQTNDPQTDLSIPRLVPNAAAPPAGNIMVPMSQLPYGQRITMEMKQIGMQSFSDDEGVRHHFEFSAEEYEGSTNGVDRILLTPIDGSKKYVFTTPINDINGLTMAFRNPYYPIEFPPDVFYRVRADAVTVGLNTFLRFTTQNAHGVAIAHNLNQDDRIYVRGFSGYQAGPIINAVINAWVNREDGHTVGSGGIAATTFRLNPDVDVSAFAVGQILSYTRIEIIVAKNRIRIPMRFRRIVDRLTNYISP